MFSKANKNQSVHYVKCPVTGRTFSTFLKIKMKLISMKQKLFSIRFLPLSILITLVSCHKTDVNQHSLRNFKQVNLVANKQEYNPKTVDPSLINGFGLAWSPTGVAWVNSVGGHVSEVYTADGAIAREAVKIPSPTDTINGLPCGIVFSGGKGFKLGDGKATFLFSGFDGVISGWNPAAGSTAIKIKSPANTSFPGLALASDGGKNFVYGADFAEHKIITWDTNFSKVSFPFTDASIPQNFSPYNIQAVGNLLYVMYAEIGTNGLPVAGSGKGFINVFTANGTFLRRFASGGMLNVPWGITAAPVGFLKDDDLTANDENKSGSSLSYGDGTQGSSNQPLILVGNFGDGRINVFTEDGRFLGQLRTGRNTLVIDGLWALSFAPESSPVDQGRLYFTAGPKQETDGLFGYIIKQ